MCLSRKLGPTTIYLYQQTQVDLVKITLQFDRVATVQFTVVPSLWPFTNITTATGWIAVTKIWLTQVQEQGHASTTPPITSTPLSRHLLTTSLSLIIYLSILPSLPFIIPLYSTSALVFHAYSRYCLKEHVFSSGNHSKTFLHLSSLRAISTHPTSTLTSIKM